MELEGRWRWVDEGKRQKKDVAQPGTGQASHHGPLCHVWDCSKPKGSSPSLRPLMESDQAEAQRIVRDKRLTAPGCYSSHHPLGIPSIIPVLWHAATEHILVPPLMRADTKVCAETP